MKITYKLIMEVFPCGDILEYLGVTDEYEATVPEFINQYCNHMAKIEYLLGFLCNEQLMSPKDLRLFAVWCVRLIECFLDDKRSINALNVAEKFANGAALFQELYNARDLAWRACEECDIFNMPRAAAASTLWFPDDTPCASVVADYVIKTAESNKVSLTYEIIDKLLEFFTARENNQEFSWLD